MCLRLTASAGESARAAFAAHTKTSLLALALAFLWGCAPPPSGTDHGRDGGPERGADAGQDLIEPSDVVVRDAPAGGDLRPDDAGDGDASGGADSGDGGSGRGDAVSNLCDPWSQSGCDAGLACTRPCTCEAIVDGASLIDQFCNNSAYCAGQAVDIGVDVCRPSHCNSAFCALPVAVPDGTPCDDGDAATFAFAAIDGCPSNRCLGGASAGAACRSDADCPQSYCFMNRCLDGAFKDAGCATDRDCQDMSGNADCVKGAMGAIRSSWCSGGGEAGHYCQLVCVGGDYDGLPCRMDSECCKVPGCGGLCPDILASPACPPAGHCARWSLDANSGTCQASRDAPYCDTALDCPTTKYCAGDPENFRGLFYPCEDKNDGCCSSIGPCLMWDACDPVTHVCQRTTQADHQSSCGSVPHMTYGDVPCVGRDAGRGGIAGGVCNNVCMGGVCISGAASCQ